MKGVNDIDVHPHQWEKEREYQGGLRAQYNAIPTCLIISHAIHAANVTFIQAISVEALGTPKHTLHCTNRLFFFAEEITKLIACFPTSMTDSFTVKRVTGMTHTLMASEIHYDRYVTRIFPVLLGLNMVSSGRTILLCSVRPRPFRSCLAKYVNEKGSRRSREKIGAVNKL